MDGWDAEVVADALDVLQDLVLWELTPRRWEQVAQILGRLDRASAAGDAEDMLAAVTDLEVSGPVRALRIGGSDPAPVPDPILERRNMLVHRLTRLRMPAADGPEEDRDVRPSR